MKHTEIKTEAMHTPEKNRRTFFSSLTTKFAIGFALVIIVSLGASYVFFSLFIKANMHALYTESAILIAEEKMFEVEQGVFGRIEQLETLTRISMVRDILIESNAFFYGLPQRDTYIQTMDNEWKSASPLTTVPLAREIESNDVSLLLKEFQNYFEETYGYPVYAELFITNKYGVNVAQTNRTSDYYQSDEAWWRTAIEDGVFVGSIVYDKSARVEAVEIAVSVTEESELLGVLKAVIDIRDLIAILEQRNIEEDDTSEHAVLSNGRTIHYTLLDDRNTVITATHNAPNFISGRYTDYFLPEVIEAKTSAFTVVREAQGNEQLLLLAHAQNKKAHINWKLLVEYDTEELLAPFRASVRNYIVTVLFISAFAAFCTMILIQKLVLRPIRALTTMAEQMTHHDFKTKVDVSARGEIGHLASVFNEMTDRVQISREMLETEVTKRTKDLEKAKIHLETKVDELEEFKRLALKREIERIELQKRNQELESAMKAHGKNT